MNILFYLLVLHLNCFFFVFEQGQSLILKGFINHSNHILEIMLPLKLGKSPLFCLSIRVGDNYKITFSLSQYRHLGLRFVLTGGRACSSKAINLLRISNKELCNSSKHTKHAQFQEQVRCIKILLLMLCVHFKHCGHAAINAYSFNMFQKQEGFPI